MGGGGSPRPRHQARGAGPDRRAARDQSRDPAQLGDPGRDRRGRPAGDNDQRCGADRGAGAGKPGAAPGERDLEERVGFLRGGARPPTAVIVKFIDAHREEHGVEPICAQLQIAPSTYYAAKTRVPSARSVTDAATTAVIERVHAENFVV